MHKKPSFYILFINFFWVCVGVHCFARVLWPATCLLSRWSHLQSGLGEAYMFRLHENKGRLSQRSFPLSWLNPIYHWRLYLSRTISSEVSFYRAPKSIAHCISPVLMFLLAKALLLSLFRNTRRPTPLTFPFMYILARSSCIRADKVTLGQMRSR